MDARNLLSVTGPDAAKFLQGLVSNEIGKLAKGPVYAALLTPQGKYLADFLLVADGEAILIDVAAPLASGLAQRLSMYRLRANVAIAPAGAEVTTGTGPRPEDAFADPRHAALPWRAYGKAGPIADDTAVRVANCIPASGIELIPNETYILEAGFERLCGVDFRKGCYVGQEVTARMKHKTALRKGLATVAVDGAAPVGTPLADAGGHAVGTLYSQADGMGIAQLRFDRVNGPLQAGAARVTWPVDTD